MQFDAEPNTPAPLPPDPEVARAALRRDLISWAVIFSLGVLIWTWSAYEEGVLNLPWHWDGGPTKGWRLTAVFVPTILALMLSPIAGGAAVLLGVLAAALVGALTLEESLSGYMDPTVWLVLAAFFLSRAFIKTGFARRIALNLVRFLGHSTLGLSYSMLISDTCLAAVIPSNAARVGGVLLPIARSLAELYKSTPGPTATVLGQFLMLSLYQGDVIACALFLTGQAGNPLAMEQAILITADQPGGSVRMGYAMWTWYALAPALVSLTLMPLLVYWWQPPSVKRTPMARQFADEELLKLGPIQRNERILFVIFITVCVLWAFCDPKKTSQTTLVAMSGVAALLLSRVITWEDCISERAAWDVFVWYGGLVLMGKKLNEFGVTHLFAKTIVGTFTGWEWLPLYLATLAIYFYAHYSFASITTHLISMYPPFVGLLIAAGAPPYLVAVTFAYFANLSAGLTHYGTTPGPIIFGLGYVPQNTWWKVGFRLSLVNFAVWLSVGMAWWRFVGLW